MVEFFVFLGFGVFYLLFVWKAGKTFPILYLFLFTYYLQYIFSTFLIYNQYENLKIQMAISQEDYFSYANVAFLCLFGGVFLFHRDLDLSASLKKIEPRDASFLGIFLIITSYIFDILPIGGTPPFASIQSFTTYLKYIGSFCLLFSNNRFRYVIIGFIYLEMAATGFKGSVFIDFFMWSTYLFFFICLKFNLPFWMRASFILLAAPVLFMIQSVKGEYREETWVRQQEGGISLFVDLIQKKNEENADKPLSETEGVVNTVSRLSQGWHLGLTLQHVPKKEPFSDGEDMLGDIVGSVLPRIVFTDKKIIGSQEKFQKYTGRKLRGGTSMTIGVLGDFYINFGVVGSYLMLFIFGAVMARILYNFLKVFVLPDPLNIIWVPFLLSYLVRANNDFYMVVNCLAKGFLIFLVINYFRKRYWIARLGPLHS
jgi:hypothetical protein